MPLRYLFGPVTAEFAEQHLHDPRRSGDCLAFGYGGSLHPAVQGERLPWLGRLARFAERYRVVIRGGVFGDDYRALLRRARVVFNRSVRGEANRRAFEALAGGALLFQEAENRELPGLLA